MKKNLKYSASQLSSLSVPLSISRGGTGASTIAQVKTALGYIPITEKDAANGIVGLNGQRKIPANKTPGISTPEFTSLDGPKEALVNSTVGYTIQYYSNLYTYTVTASSGTISRSGASITLVAPSTTQTITITVRTQYSGVIDSTIQHIVAVINASSIVNTPDVLTPSIGSINLTNAVNITSSAFSTVGGSDTHLNSDWQVSTVADFTTLVVNNSADAVNKVSYVVSNLNADTVYYARVRHRGTTIGVSGWSTKVLFATKSDFDVSYEQAIVQPTPLATNSNLGASISLSKDGFTVAIGSPGVGTGSVYVYRLGLETTTWTLVTTLVPSGGVSGDKFGSSVCVDKTGTRVAVGAPGAVRDGLTNTGAAYVYRKTSSGWIEESLPTRTDKLTGDRFGSAVSIDELGSTLLIGAKTAVRNTISSGVVYAYTRSNTTWVEESLIVPSIPSQGEEFGSSVYIESGSLACIIGAPGATVAGKAQVGKVYLYNYTGSAWTLDTLLFVNTLAASSRYGESVHMNVDRNRIVIGSPGNINNRGSVFFYSKSTVWNLVIKIDGQDSGSKLGMSVSMSGLGDISAVSAPGSLSIDSISGNPVATGEVYIYKYSTGTWSLLTTHSPSVKEIGVQYGLSISTSSTGRAVAVGSPLSGNKGKVHMLN